MKKKTEQLLFKAQDAMVRQVLDVLRHPRRAELVNTFGMAGEGIRMYDIKDCRYSLPRPMSRGGV